MSLGLHTALAEDPSLVPTSMLVGTQPPITPAPGDQMPSLFWPPQARHSPAQLPPQHTRTIKNRRKKLKIGPGGGVTCL